MLCCCKTSSEEENDTNTEQEEKEPVVRKKSAIMQWEIREWYTELRENNNYMDTKNLRMRNERKKETDQKEAITIVSREKDIADRENNQQNLRVKLEAKERDIEGKTAVLEVSIKLNEIKSEIRFEDMEKRFEEIVTASKSTAEKQLVEIISRSPEGVLTYP